MGVNARLERRLPEDGSGSGSGRVSPRAAHREQTRKQGVARESE